MKIFFFFLGVEVTVFYMYNMGFIILIHFFEKNVCFWASYYLLICKELLVIKFT